MENSLTNENNDNGFDFYHQFKWSQVLSIFLIGAGIGWLAGLSVSPVVAGIITSLLGIVTGIVTGLQSFQYVKNETPSLPKKFIIDARPAAILVISIALFAPIGILARTYHVLEPSQMHSEDDGNRQSNGIDAYTSNGANRSSQDQGVLFGVYQSECRQLLSLATMGNNKALITELNRSEIPTIINLTSEFKNEPETLHRVINSVCSFYGQN
jgi:hypothetical protein